MLGGIASCGTYDEMGNEDREADRDENNLDVLILSLWLRFDHQGSRAYKVAHWLYSHLKMLKTQLKRRLPKSQPIEDVTDLGATHTILLTSKVQGIKAQYLRHGSIHSFYLILFIKLFVKSCSKTYAVKYLYIVDFHIF